MTQPNIRVERSSPLELTEAQIAELMSFGGREAKLLDELEAATRRGDRERAWELCLRLCDVEDEARMTA